MLIYQQIQQYARAIDTLDKDDCIWDFMNETFKEFCWPDQEQKFFYSEYKKQHEYKYQAVIYSDEIVAALSESYERKINNFYMIKNSKLEEDCETLMKSNSSYYLYDDCVYKQLAYIFDSFQDDKSLSIEKQLFNKQ